MNIRIIGIAVTCALTVPSVVLAAPPSPAEAEAEVEAEVEAEAEAEADSRRGARSDLPWIERWAPEPMTGELGAYGGVLLPTARHELFSPDLELAGQGFRELAVAAPDVGLRAGFYPLRFFGVEAEGGVMPTSTRDGAGSALLYTFRGHLVGQLGLWSVTPFVLVGAGGLGVSSDRTVLGDDLDPALHFGGGLKFYINRYVMLRLDVRDVVSYKSGVENYFIAHSPEILLGLSVTLGRKKTRQRAADRDGDGIYDAEDSCPEEPETVNDYEDADGCPEADADGDGFFDGQDSCPEEPETVNDYEDEDGCPESDTDGDGLFDGQDSCPEEPETVNDYEDEDGCPESDTDGDGLYDGRDSCPEEPETANGYQDEDGCADEVPKAMRAFTGAIKGITFDNDKDTIRKSSLRTLDKAVKVLTDNPSVRIRINGHTDARGDHDYNVELSKRRADAVKRYLVDHGVDASRMETAGIGPDRPVDTNETRAGRANNRRIEFELIK